MSDGRTRRSIAAIVAAALASPLLTPGTGHAEPDPRQVRAEVDRLYHQAEMASERYNDVRLEVERAREELGMLRREVRRQRQTADRLRRDVASAMVQEYQGQAFSSTTQVLLSDHPDEFLQRLSTVRAYDEQQLQTTQAYAIEARRLELRQQAKQRTLAEIVEHERRLAQQKRTIRARAAEADELLSRLEAEERRVMAEQQAPRAAQVSGRAGAVVDYALAQVGKAYVWAAAGPSSYDCSGLTMMAWARAGVRLPHSASSQMSAGTPVSRSQLKPGDLVFYYSPVSHVGIYIGNGQIVDAANPSTGVRVADVDSMPFSGAVRPG